MPSWFFGRGKAIEKAVKRYRGWRVLDLNGNEIGKVESVDYEVNQLDNGKLKIIIKGFTVVKSSGERISYTTKNNDIKIDEEKKVVVVKPKDELVESISEASRNLEETAKKLREVNNMLIKLGEVILKGLASGDKVPQDLIEKFRTILVEQRENYIKDCESKIERLEKLMVSLDDRIGKLESEYAELRLKYELGQLNGDEKVRLDSLKDEVTRLKEIRDNLANMIYKYRSECI